MSRRAGFTLLEVAIALLLMAVIGGMVVGISRTSLDLGKAIVDKQGTEMEQQAFFELLGRRFASLPGNARLELASVESGNLYLSDLTLQQVPMSFTWGGRDLLAGAVQLSTVKTRSGYLDIVLRYYENEILEDSASGSESIAQQEEPFAEIVLLRDVAFFEWRALDPTVMEWLYDWDQKDRQPLQLELVMAIGAEGKTLRHVFWLPPKVDPAVVMRQMGAGAQPFPVTPASPTHFETRDTGVSIEVNPSTPQPGGGR